MPLVYSNEMLQADNLIDYLKETEEEFSGLAVFDSKNNKSKLVATVVGPPLALATQKENIFSSIRISIEEVKIPPKDLKVYVGTKNTGYPDYDLYKDFIEYAYKNLIDKDKRKALVTPKYVLVPYGPDFEEFEYYSTYPSYLVYER